MECMTQDPSSLSYSDVVALDSNPSNVLIFRSDAYSIFNTYTKGLQLRVCLFKSPAHMKWNEKPLHSAQSFQHPNIHKIYNILYGNSGLAILSEYAESDLYSLISDTGALEMGKVFKYGIQLIQAFKYLHGEGICHGHFSTQSVLVVAGMVKVGNLSWPKEYAFLPHESGTDQSIYWRSPESIAMEGNIGPAGDMYSYGLVLWSMVSGLHPYQDLSPEEAAKAITSNKTPEIPPMCPYTLASIIASCLEYNSRSRINASDAAVEMEKGQKNPGLPHVKVKKSTMDMRTSELVQYLEQKKVFPSFISKIEELQYTGKDLFQLDYEVLAGPIFGLSPFQSNLIVAIIDECKAQHESCIAERGDGALRDVISSFVHVKYSISTKLGQGGFGDVYEGVWDGKKVAVKFIDLASVKRSSLKLIEMIANEIKTMQVSKHPNIIPIFDATIESDCCAIILELADIPLDKLVKRKKDAGEFLPIEEVVRYSIHICEGLNHMHRLGYYHRDIKAANILIVNGIAKLADFGLSSKKIEGAGIPFPMSSKLKQLQVGTPHWQGPEIHDIVAKQPNANHTDFTKGHIGAPSDVYPVGLLICFMLSNEKPFDATEFPMYIIASGIRPNIPPQTPQVLQRVIGLCWRQNYQLRPSLDQVISVLKSFQESKYVDLDMAHIDEIAPLKYSSFLDMYPGELVELFREKGFSADTVEKIRKQQPPVSVRELLGCKDSDLSGSGFELSPEDASSMVRFLRACKMNENALEKVSLESDYESTTPENSAASDAPDIATETPQCVKEMSNEELIRYLEDKNVIRKFVGVIAEFRTAGKDFLGLTKEDLASHPFNLTGFQSRSILKIIDEAKQAQ